ncbi:MAG: putative Ig domain-containing protein [Acidobacteria bacterium]|nr:putative Ig domain-containing protein [Acidobacteriota bacterium]
MTMVASFVSAGVAVSQTAPRVVSVSFANEPVSGDTYGFAARIQLQVDFDQDVVVIGSPRLALEVGSTLRQASYYYYSGATVHFVYLVQADDMDGDGITIPADALSGATITLASDGSVSAALEHGAVAGGSGRKVDGSSVDEPRIVSWYIQGSPRTGDTYGLGEEIYAAFEFDRGVTVTGEPRLPIQIGERTRNTTRWAHGVGSGFLDPLGTKLRLFYTVQAEDLDSDGISFAANSLTVDGGSIALAGRSDVLANLNHGAVADDPTRKVDGSLGPKVTGVSFTGSPDSGDTYTLGETIQVLVELDQSVRFDRRTRLALAIGERTRQAALDRAASSVGMSATFEYLVQPADLDADGISIPANAMTLEGAAVTADLSHEAVASDPDRKVDGTVAVAPKIANVTFTSRPWRAGDGNGFPVYGNTYGLGEAIVVAVDFDKPVRATGNPQVTIAVGGSTRQATFTGRVFPYRRIILEYVVEAGDTGSGAISIPRNALTLNGGAITMQGDASIVADLRHDEVAGEHEVDGSAGDAPRVLYGAFGVFLTGPADADAYRRGETIEAGVFLDRRVEVSGEPQLALEIGARTRRASFREVFSRGSNTWLYFDYVVQAEDMDGDGIGLPANAVTLNGGAITLAGAPSVAAELTHERSAFRAGVDGSTSAMPRVTLVDIVWSPASGGSYSLGETIHSRACFSGGVRVAGRPGLTLQIGARTRQASYRGSYFQCGYYQFQVQAQDVDSDGIEIPANAVTLNGGSVTLAGDDSVVADLTHDAPVPTDGFDRGVDAGVIVAPRLTSVSFTGNPVAGDTYGSGETIEVRVAFDKALTVSGDVRLALTVGSRRKEATFVRQERSDSLLLDDIFLLFFEYAVQPGDMDMDGISIPANALDLNGGSLTLMGSPGTAADLSHSAVNPDETRLVDAPDTAPTFSTAIAGQVWLVNEAVSLELPEAVGGDGELTYSLSPELPAGLTFDAGTRLLSGMPTALADRMAFQYTVTDGDLEDPESATLTFSMSVIAQSASEVGAQSVGDDSVEVAWRGQWSDESRGRLVIEARSPTMDWTVVGTVDPSSGEFVVRGLEPETPHTFRLRFESPDRAAARTASAQTSAEYSEEFSVTTGSYTGACRSGGKYLCLRDGRFELRADWTNPDRVGDFGVGTAVPVDISDESGLFWFFSPANIELVTKVLDGSRLNGYYWMFFGALSDVEYWLTLRDTAVGGAQRTYHNPPKEVCGQSDTRAFPGDLAALLGLSSSDESSIPGGLDPVQVAAVPLELSGTADASDSGGSCESSDERLCLLGNRFSVEVSFIDPNISDPDVNPEGTATVAPSLGTANTGFFWFFNRENIELAVKVLDGRGINGRFWLLYGALSDVEYEIVVTDTVTGESKMYRNEAGSLCGEVDTKAFG